ncbi:transmembrane protein 269 isoform X2 [Heliangelus exortis]|uniref:transmembrane protein 269 isoform X2 n=1 Tax=Heliangelus exortis TaxID=472823 RepID=UPI003A90CF15
MPPVMILPGAEESGDGKPQNSSFFLATLEPPQLPTHRIIPNQGEAKRGQHRACAELLRTQLTPGAEGTLGGIFHPQAPGSARPAGSGRGVQRSPHQWPNPSLWHAEPPTPQPGGSWNSSRPDGGLWFDEGCHQLAWLWDHGTGIFQTTKKLFLRERPGWGRTLEFIRKNAANGLSVANLVAGLSSVLCSLNRLVLPSPGSTTTPAGCCSWASCWIWLMEPLPGSSMPARRWGPNWMTLLTSPPSGWPRLCCCSHRGCWEGSWPSPTSWPSLLASASSPVLGSPSPTGGCPVPTPPRCWPAPSC